MDILNHTGILQGSVAISPPDAVIEQVRELKQKLRSSIGWYHSVNAMAHITFNVFQADAGTLLRWEAYTDLFASQQSPVSLRFNHINNSMGRAFFLEPDEVSEKILVDMMKSFHSEAPSQARRSITPHISIGRRLTLDQLSTAGELIPEVNIYFVCSDVVLRRFHEARGQYDIYRRFPFGVRK